MKKFRILLLALLLFYSIPSNGFEGDGNEAPMKNCDTSKYIDEAQTKITFYGDSRMDFVNKGSWYGNNTMAKILNEPYNGAVPYSSGDLFSDDKKGY